MAIRRRFLQNDVGWQDVKGIRGSLVGDVEQSSTYKWRTVYLYMVGAVALVVLFISSVNLQVVRGRELLSRSQDNRLIEHVIIPDRGVIYDRAGKKLAVNVPSFNVVIDPHEVKDDELDSTLARLSIITKISEQKLKEKYDEALKTDVLTDRVLLAQDVDRDKVLSIRSHSDELPGVWVEYGSKRKYVGGKEFSQILGYTGESNPDDLKRDENIKGGDIVGKDGLEFYYDSRFRGKKGVEVAEIDVLRNVIAQYVNSNVPPVPGDSLYLTIDADSQKKMYSILSEGMKKYGATGAAGVLEDVRTGEVWASVSVPSYDNNLFVGGISTENYQKLLKDKKLPLFNRVISAQEPPGSMFKTIVASAALQEKAITRNTVFTSVGTLYTENGAFLCREYENHVYGALNLIGGIAKSSNIYFFHTMETLGIKRFLPYASFFGIGSQTGIDLPGEAKGRVHSPQNKVDLSRVSPWVDPIWYPGDNCNAAIGQGLTVVTPLQVANWAAAIANGGKVLKPHFAGKWEPGVAKGETDLPVEKVKTEVVRKGKVSASNLSIVREGMRNSASGPQSIIVPFRYTKVAVAGKTGTAEFGVKDKKGYYTKTHAWVMGFFPYDNPKYSFVFFLEGGGASNNAAELAKNFINWFADTKLK